jgi:hypothetical protein
MPSADAPFRILAVNHQGELSESSTGATAGAAAGGADSGEFDALTIV